MTEETNNVETTEEGVKEVHVPAQEEAKKVRLDDVVLKRELATGIAMLNALIQNNQEHAFIGEIHGALIILKTVNNALPREVIEEDSE